MGKDIDLMQAVRDEDLSLLQKLLERSRSQRSKLIGSAKKLNVNFQDASGMSALHQAALSGSIDIMRLLLDNGAVVDIVDSKNMRPLHYGSWQGHDGLVELLLLHGSDVNQPASDGNSPLHLASEHGHFCVVRKLLEAGADPTLTNHHHRSPLDVACEFGRIRVVELLLDAPSVQSLIDAVPQLDNLDNERTTCLHLAARNGHVDIIKLLLEAGVDINRQTLQGTCLHEAAMFGKTEVVALLLSSGIDVNRLNSYEQTALEVVNKFTASRGAREIKQMLRDASSNVRARAVKDYCNAHDSSHISFREGDLITVTEQHPTSGLWKGFRCTTSGLMTRPGYFPATSVVLIDPQSIDEHVKRAPSGVGRRTVVDVVTWQQQQHHSAGHHVITDGSAENGIVRPPSYQTMSALQTTVPMVPPNLTVHTVPGFGGGDVLLCKESPSGSSHGSTSGSGSGPYQTACHACNGGMQQHRLSGQSCESGVSSSSRQSYHSGASTGSSSSQGSLDRLEESGYSSSVNVYELMRQGRSDEEVLRTWLMGLRLDDYFQMFVVAGYDMPTISRMTPEDLTAIGITKPSARKKLKSEIGKLTIHDGIPDFKPSSVSEWLNLLRLSEYIGSLECQGYADIDSITDITWEDLEDIGITKLGHQKKIMLAIDRLKRIGGSLRRLSSNKRSDVDSPYTRHVSRVQSNDSSVSATCMPMSSACVQPVPPTAYHNGHTPQLLASTYDNVTLRCPGGNVTSFVSPPPTIYTAAGLYQPNLNPVAEMSAASVVSCEEMSRQSGHHVASVQSHQAVVVGSRGPESDGDVTPTNERRLLPSRPVDEFSQGGIVTRPAAYVVPSPKPVAMVTAKAKPSENNNNVTVDPWQTMKSNMVVSETAESSGMNFSYGTLPRKFSQKRRLAAANDEELFYADMLYENATCPSQSPAAVLCLEPPKERFQTDPNSNCHVVRKEPPVPPKRTHSFKTDLRMPFSNPHASSGAALTNNGPHATLASSCSNGPSFRASAAGSTDLFGGAENILSEVIERLERSSSASTVRRNTGPRLGDWQDGRLSNDSSSGSEDSDSGLDSRRSESSTSLGCSASCGANSSSDVHTLPFANENVGTIKQRGSSSSKPSVVTSSDSGDVELNSSLFTPTTISCSASSASANAAVSNTESEALFSDIDGMLLGLTAELDEMLKLQG